jgi:hypothetical protein
MNVLMSHYKRLPTMFYVYKCMVCINLLKTISICHWFCYFNFKLVSANDYRSFKQPSLKSLRVDKVIVHVRSFTRPLWKQNLQNDLNFTIMALKFRFCTTCLYSNIRIHVKNMQWLERK